MALAVRGLGLPWIHTDVVCDNCKVLPIQGYRYKCESCSEHGIEHNLCEKCHRHGQPHLGHRFLQIARDSKQFHPPFQVYYIVCGDCGQAPIEGRCHRNRWRPNYSLCNDCYSRLPQTGSMSLEWEVLDEPKISTICRTRSPVYHFHRQCGSCGDSPITGPRFDSIAYPEYSLCLICYDSKFIKGLVKNADYHRIERPEPHKVRHIFMYACCNCGEVPIDGPAYVNKRLQDRVLCLLCFMSIHEDVQLEYSRVEPPSQLGDPPVLALTGSGVETVSMEEFSKLADDFERFREEKEAAARQVASNLMNQAHKNQQLQKELEEMQRQSADHSSVFRELEALKAEKEEAKRLLADHASLVQALERMEAERIEESSRKSLEYETLAEKVEKLMLDKEEDARMIAHYRSLAQESERLKGELEEVGRTTERNLSRMKELQEAVSATEEKCTKLSQENAKLLAEKEEAAEYASIARELETLDESGSTTSAEYLNIVQEVENLKLENSRLIQDLEQMKKQTNEAAKLSADKYLNLSQEFDQYKTEKDDYSRLADEKERILEEKQLEMNVNAEKLAHLTSEFEILKQLCDDKERLSVERQLELNASKAMYANATRDLEILTQEKDQGTDYVSLVAEKEKLLEEKELELNWNAEKLANLARELEILKQEKDIDCSVLVQKCEQLSKDKAWLIAQVEKIYEEKDADAEDWGRVKEAEFKEFEERKKAEFKEFEETKEAEFREWKQAKEAEFRELEKAHEVEAMEWEHSRTNLNQELEKLKLEKDSIEALHGSLTRRFEKSEKEKELMTANATDYSGIVKELERSKAAREKELEEKEVAYVILSEEFERLKIEKEQEIRELEDKFMASRKGSEKMQETKEEMAMLNASLSVRLEQLEKQKEHLQAAARISAEELSSLQRDYDNLVGEKEAVEKISEQLTVQLQNLEVESRADYSSLEEEFERYKQDPGEVNIVKTPQYKKLAKELEKLQKDAYQYEELFEDLVAVETEYEESKKAHEEEIAIATAKYEKLIKENAEATRMSKEELSRLSEEIEILKSTYALELSGMGKCSQVALCTYGAFLHKEKLEMEQGYKTSLSRIGSKTAQESDNILADLLQKIDDDYDKFKREVQSVTDSEAKDFYVNVALPTQQKEMKIKAAFGKLKDLNLTSELTLAKKRFGK